jgi:hypothetical protein
MNLLELALLLDERRGLTIVSMFSQGLPEGVVH